MADERIESRNAFETLEFVAVEQDSGNSSPSPAAAFPSVEPLRAFSVIADGAANPQGDPEERRLRAFDGVTVIHPRIQTLFQRMEEVARSGAFQIRALIRSLRPLRSCKEGPSSLSSGSYRRRRISAAAFFVPSSVDRSVSQKP
jgi:hypothetical protein